MLKITVTIGNAVHSVDVEAPVAEAQVGDHKVWLRRLLRGGRDCAARIRVEQAGHKTKDLTTVALPATEALLAGPATWLKHILRNGLPATATAATATTATGNGEARA